MSTHCVKQTRKTEEVNMSKEIEEKFKKILSQLSHRELQNRALAKQTTRVLIAIEYLKAVTRKRKDS